ncbi:DOT1-domain-containing protein [Amniculicola lignicola CBS 123094]|uniref:Histone-lysine N-methyltransferase, H3 lysine-79 specific n=1 Tax=Amniculicola lignicola CBS 123094 TaxID=1392246 RepID=A0A6A5WTG7_9PLEO|nr:DOT1-domain-containing protein [Amniculicola lignicola CBS 123094]
MNMFDSGAKPKIRTRTVAVPVKKTPASSAQVKITAPAAAAPASRYTLTPSTKQRTTAQARPARQTLAVSRVQQRKRKVTPTTPQFASSSDDDSSADEARSKRQKTSSVIETPPPPPANKSLEPDLDRRIRIQGDGAASLKPKETAAKMIHGEKMTRGSWAKYFKPAFPGGDQNLVVELQYPSPSRPERFEAVVRKVEDNEEFSPLLEIYWNMEEMIQHYLPPDISASLADETNGAVRLLKRAVAKSSLEDFKAALSDFNTAIKERLADGTIPATLDAMHAIPFALVKRILLQVYQRTVSPHAHLLRRVKGKETTYGELLPPFTHTIFQQTGLKSSHVFVDLGSGVGNVVLQSALQTGAESWGIEVMDTPALYANNQAEELRARAKLWNISLGPIHLLHGDFLKSDDIGPVLSRADVVLVNNKVFPQQLNGALLDKFLDLKVGCKVVSLASFGGGNKQGVRNEWSIANLFDEHRYDSGTSSVSWAGESVEYFIATKIR